MKVISNLTGRTRIGECIKCGNCCKVQDWRKSLESDRLLQVMKQFDIDIESIIELCKEHNFCRNLASNNLCILYEYRPNFCKNFPRNEWEKEFHDCQGYKFINDR